MIRKSLLTEEEMADYRAQGMQIQELAMNAGISRQAVRDALKRHGSYNPTPGSEERQCLFCGEKFRTYLKNDNKYCSQQCFHASRSLWGEYSKQGGSLTRIREELNQAEDRKMGKWARKAVQESGIKLRKGQVVHHINGDRTDNRLENLRVFSSNAAHMRFHHAQRKDISGKVLSGN